MKSTSSQSYLHNQKEKKGDEITENEQCIRKSAKDGKKQATNNTRSQNLKQKLTPTRQICSGKEHQVAIDENQKQVSNHRRCAGQESVGLLARLLCTTLEGEMERG